MPNVSDWSIIVYEVILMNYKKYKPRLVDKIVDKY